MFVIDSGYFECGDILKLQDCSDSDTYYFVNGPLTFNGSGITINDIFTAELNGEENVLLTFQIQTSSTHFISNISEIHNECCIPSPSPTPSVSPTVTPSTTPSVTPTQSPRAVLYMSILNVNLII